MPDLSVVLGRIRDLVNEPRRLHRLLSDRSRWGQLCASMDAVGDVELALNAYLDGQPITSSAGENYIIVYGTLQLLYVQQDAVRHLRKCVGLETTFDSAVSEVRTIRNASIGHPTRTDGRGRVPPSSNFIVRVSITRDGFTLMREPENAAIEGREVDLPKLISQQRASVERLLQEAILTMQEDELKHRRQFRGVRMESSFEGVLHHGLEKIQSWVSSEDTSFAEYGLGVVQGAVNSFRSHLSDRGLLDVYRENITREIDETEYVIGRLRECFEGRQTVFTSDDRAVFLHSLRNHLESLQGFAHSLDSEYESDSI